MPVGGGARAQSTAMMASISTAQLAGTVRPMALRAWRPASPKSSMKSSLQPWMTEGVSLKSGADVDHAEDLDDLADVVEAGDGVDGLEDAERAELGGAVAFFGGQVLTDLAHDLLTAEAGDLAGDVDMVAGADCGHQIPAVEVDLLEFVAHFFQFCQIRHF